VFADGAATTFYAPALPPLMLAEFWDIAAVSAIASAPLVLAHAILLLHCANFAESVAATGFALFPLPLMLVDVATATLFTIAIKLFAFLQHRRIVRTTLQIVCQV